MKNISLSVLFIVSIFACNSLQETEVSDSSAQANMAEIIEQPLPELRKVEEKEIVKTVIDFGEYELIIHDLESNIDNDLKTQDTIEINKKMGNNFENILIEIKPTNKFDSFQLFIARESRLIAYVDEKDIRELSQWNKLSTYKEIIDSNNYFFRIRNNGIKTRNLELELEFDSIKSVVLKFDGEYIDDETQQADSLSDLFLELWMSRTFIKIIRSNGGEQEQKLFVSNSSWGC